MATLDTAFEAIVTLALLALLVERALAVMFESELWLSNVSHKGVTNIVKLIVSYVVCRAWDIDVFTQSIVSVGKDGQRVFSDPSPGGIAMTALIVAGGTVGVKKLFHDFLDIKSSALRAKQG